MSGQPVGEEPGDGSVADGRAAGGDAQDAPVMRVLAGRPTPAELAALVAVLTARAAAAAPGRAPRARPSRWGHPTTLVRQGAAVPGWRALPGS
ncbi:acyl-CoA carboxylase subunit epsilon [Aquipuribacter sp. SD81]|uniref:acyl-CoA carboxylase subunit epsilon n=1 Tax=Aquipuribacter sp. SD81 TaxID=3127703 RepID=UPI00301B3F1B